MAENPVTKKVKDIASDWADQTERVFTEPDVWIKAMQKTGEFGKDAIEFAGNEVRETYVAGKMSYNVVTDVIESDCEDKWSLLVTTALPALGAALWLLIVPQPGEILEEYLQPKSLKTGSRGGRDAKKVRRGKGRSGKIRRLWPRLPDTNKMIANVIPGAEWVRGRRVGTGQRVLFAGIDKLDHVLWYWLLLEAGETFFTRWNTGIMESGQCRRPKGLVVAAEIEESPQIDEAEAMDPAVWTVLDQVGLEEPGNNLALFERGHEITVALRIVIWWPFNIGVPFEAEFRLFWWDENGEQQQINYEVERDLVTGEMVWEAEENLPKTTRLEWGRTFVASDEVIRTSTWAVFSADDEK